MQFHGDALTRRPGKHEPLRAHVLQPHRDSLGHRLEDGGRKVHSGQQLSPHGRLERVWSLGFRGQQGLCQRDSVRVAFRADRGCPVLRLHELLTLDIPGVDPFRHPTLRRVSLPECGSLLRTGADTGGASSVGLSLHHEQLGRQQPLLQAPVDGVGLRTQPAVVQ